MTLSRDDILKRKDVVTEDIEVPEWEGTVRVRGLTGRQRDEFEASILERRGKQMVPNVANIRAKLVARCLVDDEGNRIFTDADATELGEHSAAIIDKLYEAASRLSGLSEEDVEEMVENFGEMAGSSSNSSSPNGSGKRPANSSTSPTPAK